ncbi:kinesin-like nuclear fusion protein [Entomortierella lignicola]|nr:kinesin-like nuclear fusion protein [Entomortierella lignicola]KAF9205418.1 kinesin-like nuclear fusion protein [Haplosporangium sp. Z 27]
MEQLNRSISKLKPPTKITSSSTSSSTIATALAVAAALGGNENSTLTNNQNNIAKASATKAAPATTTKKSNGSVGVAYTTSTATATQSLKRKADDSIIEKRTRSHPATSKPPLTSNTTTATVNKKPTSNAVNGNKSQVGNGASARPPLARVGQRSATSTATNRPTVAPSRASTSASAASTRAKAGPLTTNRVQATPRTRNQQPTPPLSTSSSISESRLATAGADAGTDSSQAVPAELSSAEILNTLALSKKKKRPAWDTKGRLEDMEELTSTLHHLLQTSASNMTDLNSKLESSESKISELETFRQSLESKVAVKESENKDILQKMRHVEQDLQMTARHHEDEIRSLKSQHSMEMEQLRMMQARLKQETDMLETKLRSTNTQLDQQMQENTSLRATISTQSSNCLALESDNRALKMKIERTENTLAQRESTIETLERKLSESQTTVQELEQRIRQEETIRRRLHNTIQELKGNIRVFCRVRPVVQSESASKAETTTALIKYPDQEGREIEFAHATESATGSQIEKTYPFTFDKVFQASSTQDDVFEEISQLVQSALDGYNVCIFAYGQTGSGKTHTMEGPLNADAKSMGMIPRSVMQIYENARALESKGWVYTMEGQYVEIYNETVNDLLGNDGLETNKKHEIRHGPNGKTTITDITTVVLTSPEKVAALLKKAAHNRSVGSTQMNERSSRSHCVFTLRLSGKNTVTEESSEGVLNLIDLAGSERLSQSGATGDRLRETQAINKSLSCLGDVIYAISNKDPHIPYRNSKLTYLLQNSLGGNSKTLMFVNISPLMSNFNETLCSLRFATKVNACTIGTATKRAVKS